MENINKLENRQVPSIIEALKDNFNINSNVLNHFYCQVRQPRERREVPATYMGALDKFNYPYVRVNEAWVNKDDFDIFYYKQTTDYNKFKSLTKQDFEKGWNDYSRGFKLGYFTFDEKYLLNSPFKNEDNIRQKTFDYIMGKTYASSGLPESFGRNVHIFSEWENAGIKQGYIYRAWYLIIENYFVFKPLFDNMAGFGNKLSLVEPTPTATNQPEKIPNDTTSNYKEAILNHFSFFIGNNVYGEKIMKNEDYEEMVSYFNKVLVNQKLPNKILKIPQINLPNNFLIYTFYSFHKKVFGTKKIKNEIIDFLHSSFLQLKDNERSTIKTKFSKKPTNYDQDLKRIKG